LENTAARRGRRRRNIDDASFQSSVHIRGTIVLGFLFLFFFRIFSRAHERIPRSLQFSFSLPTREETKGRGEMRPLRYKSHALRAGSRSNELLAPFRACFIPL
jgi:hypothetical protein